MEPITLGILAYLSTLMGKSKTADKLEFFPTNLEIIKNKLVYSMEILNPTNNNLKVDSFFGGVYADDKKVGSIEMSEPINIAKKSRTKVKFPVKVGTIGTIQLIADVISGKAKKKFKIAGVARALGLDNPISKELTL